MSSYEGRYEVCANRVAFYTHDPREALSRLDSDPENGWAAEGYADYEDISYGHRDFGGIEGMLVTRRQIGPLTRQQLQLRVTQLEYAEQRHLVETLYLQLTGQLSQEYK